MFPHLLLQPVLPGRTESWQWGWRLRSASQPGLVESSVEPCLGAHVMTYFSDSLGGELVPGSQARTLCRDRCSFGRGAEALGCSRVLLQRVSAQGARVYVGEAGGSTWSGTLAPRFRWAGCRGWGGTVIRPPPVRALFLWSFLFVVREAKPFVPL